MQLPCHPTASPPVTVSVTTYNRSHLVSTALDSVLAQSYPNLEVIVVDDGSTDDTRRVIEERYGPRVRYIYQPNQGQASARNTSIAAAQGEYIALMDDDDVWLPTKLERQIAALQRHPECAFAYCAAHEGDVEARSTGRIYGSSGRGRTGDCFALYLRRTIILEPSVVLRAGIMEQIGRFDETLPHRGLAKDTDFFLRVLMHYPAVYVREPLLIVRQHAGRVTRSHAQQGEDFQASVQIMTKLLGSLPAERAHLRLPIIRQLLWSDLRLAARQAPTLGWEQFAARLRGVFDRGEQLWPPREVAGWTIEALTQWERSHPDAIGPAHHSAVAALLAEIAAAAGTGGAPPIWHSRLRATLAAARLAEGRLHEATALGWGAARTHPLLALGQGGWALARGAGKRLIRRVRGGGG